MKKLLKWALVLVVGFAVCVVVVLYNPHIIKGSLERTLSKKAGYSVSLNGDIELDIGKLIKITANHVQVSGPDWAHHEELVSVGHLELVLKTSTLFEDTILIETLRVDDMQLNLETNADGKGNWISANQPSTHSGEKRSGAIVVFNDIQASNAVLRYRNGKSDVENVFRIDSLKHLQQADGMLHTTLNGDLNNRVVEYTHTVGPYVNLLNGQNIDFTGSGHFGELVLNGSAFIDDLREPRNPKFNLDLEGPNTREITDMFGIQDLGGGVFSLRTSGAQSGDVYEAGINGTVGHLSLNASATTSDITEYNDLDLNVAMNGPSLGAVTRAFGMEHWPDKPFSLDGSAKRVGKTLNVNGLKLHIGGTHLSLDALLTDFPTLDASRIKLLISGDEITQFHELIGIKGAATGPFSVEGKLDVSPDGLELLNVKLGTSLGNATLSGTLGKPPDYTGSKLDLNLDGDNANKVMGVFGIDMLPEKPFNLNTRLEVVKGGLQLERGVLVTIEDERLELGGFIALGQGSKGTNVDVKLSGKHFARVIRQHVGLYDVPDGPYQLSGQLKVLEEGIGLQDTTLEFEGIRLNTGGLVRLDEQLAGTALNFQIKGDNLSALNRFKAVGDSLSMFVPGQSYEAAGKFMIEKNGFKLEKVNGRIGNTTLDVDALISKQAGLDGSNIRLSAKGPNLGELLVTEVTPGLSTGVFEASAAVALSDQTLKISELKFRTEKSRGDISLELGWPFVQDSNISFDVHVLGDDIRHFVPPSDTFEIAAIDFNVNAKGSKKGDSIAIEQFESRVGNLHATLQGSLGNHSDDDHVELTFELVSEDISQLGRFKGEPLNALDLSLKADFKGNTRAFVLQNLLGSLGKSHINGELEVSLADPRPSFRLTANSDYLDLRPFIAKDEKAPEKKNGTKAKPDRLIPATPVPFEALSSIDFEIDLKVAELEYLQDSITNLVLDLTLQDGALTLSESSYEAPSGKFRVSLSVNPGGLNQADVKIDLSTTDFVLNLSALDQDQLDTLPAFDINFVADGKGGNLQDIAGSMNGSFYMGSKGGDAKDVDLSILDTFIFDQIFSVIMPKSDAELDNQFSCIAARLDIVDGLVKTQPALAFTTGKIAVVTKGTLDLKTEKMQLDFNSTPTNALQVSAGEMFHPYLLISGTLAKPSVGVAPGKAVLHGGAAIATAGLSILAKGVLDRASNAVPVCEEMLKNPPN